MTHRTRTRGIPFLVPLLLLLLLAGGVVPASAVTPRDAGVLPDPPWTWPVEAAREITEPYRAPAHAYGAGHRGIDVVAPHGSFVHAPADGIVAFRGTVVDRPLITITHADGVVSTLEPVDSSLMAGDAVVAGDRVGTAGTGGHSAPGTLHIGVRVNGAYVDPLSMFGGAQRSVLLPCCAGR